MLSASAQVQPVVCLSLSGGVGWASVAMAVWRCGGVALWTDEVDAPSKTKVPRRAGITAEMPILDAMVLAFSPDALTLRTELYLGSVAAGAVHRPCRGDGDLPVGASMRRELTTEHQLFAENRAFALRDNFEILEDELKRLALLPPIDRSDGDLMPRAADTGRRAPELGPLQTAVLLLSADGTCLRRCPTARSSADTTFGDRPGSVSSRGATGPTSAPATSRTSGRTIKIVQPHPAQRAFAGALVGVIALGEAEPHHAGAARATAAHTDATLDRRDGRIIYPPDRVRPPTAPDWARRSRRGTAAARCRRGQRAGGAFAFRRCARHRFAVVFALAVAR